MNLNKLFHTQILKTVPSILQSAKRNKGHVQTAIKEEKEYSPQNANKTVVKMPMLTASDLKYKLTLNTLSNKYNTTQNFYSKGSYSPKKNLQLSHKKNKKASL